MFSFMYVTQGLKTKFFRPERACDIFFHNVFFQKPGQCSGFLFKEKLHNLLLYLVIFSSKLVIFFSERNLMRGKGDSS